MIRKYETNKDQKGDRLKLIIVHYILINKQSL